ncbi:MAG TPA: excinuclease ABC subunit UvrC [Candidatus Bilamarchaeum sp.]|nr:excinuclease ABC subunit UvrC [Candidatus Bilamarchaeum sp.]
MIFERSKYPELPGVYLMKGKDASVIYVGKAASLRSRLSQYFGPQDSLKTKLLVGQIDSIDFVVTKDPHEALILESNFIKSYQPKYNMILKDAKHYSYLAVTDEEFPRLLVARKNSGGKFRVKAAKFYGPFVEGSKRAISARYLRKLFKIRICGKLPKRECLQYHLGNCDAPCIGKIGREDYARNVSSLCSVLEGKEKARELMDNLKSRMKEASASLDFEKAASLRDQMESLRIFFERQRVERNRRADEDFVWFQRIGANLHVLILRSRNGVIGKTEKHHVAVKEQEDPEASFCMQYYSELPDAVYSNMPEGEIPKLNAAFGSEVFLVPGKEKAKVLEIAAKSLTYGELEPAVIRLKEELSLDSNPVVVETFDISTLFGEESVGSMVQFVNGKPNKSGYRRFRIKHVEGQDDFAMMKEVVSRRYSRLLSEGDQMPDLVLIDGGAGQLHAAMDGMDEAGIRLPVAALAKKEEEVYLPNRMHTLRLAKTNPALRLLQACRDEAHRFAVTYQRLRRGKKMKE